MTETNEDVGVDLGELTKIGRYPPKYTWSINGHLVDLRAEDILSQARFARCCFEQLDIIPAAISRVAWRALINERLSTLRVMP